MKSPRLDPLLESVTGYTEFASQFAGCCFDDGLYRIHDARTGEIGADALAEAFPEFARRAHVFAYDWLGRQFALDGGRVDGGQPLVLLMEPGTGEALEIPAPFAAFHNEVLVDDAEAALAAGFFSEWVDANPSTLPLRADQCVGYRTPLFLGGQDTVENLELTDFDVYWSMAGQLLRRSKGLPISAKIGRIDIADS